MAISNITAGSVASASAQTIEISRPGTYTDGQLLLVFGYLTEAGTLTLNETGFTSIAQFQTSLGADTVGAIWYKTVDTGSDPTTFTLDHDVGVNHPMKGWAVTLDGHDTSTPMDTSAVATADTSNSTTLTPDDITTTTDNAYVITYIFSQNGSTSGTEPTGYTLILENGTSQYVGVAGKTITSAGTESPGDWTTLSATNDGGGITMAIRAAVDASAYYYHSQQ